jgi:hypothetical protein
MKIFRQRPEQLTGALCILAVAAIMTAAALLAGGARGTAQSKSDTSGGTRLHLEITGGDPAAPIDSASIYVRYVVKHRMAKDEKVEMNLKTNHDGTVLVPFVPRGEITIQIVAEHWKPFGEKYQMTEDEQTVKIHLEKPPKWY